MAFATLPDLKKRIEAIARRSDLGSRIRNVDIDADEDPLGGAFLRVSFVLDQTNDLEWDSVEPLVRSIEDSVAEVDERFPSVYFADAA
jgi:hypothetical protein